MLIYWPICSALFSQENIGLDFKKHLIEKDSWYFCASIFKWYSAALLWSKKNNEKEKVMDSCSICFKNLCFANHVLSVSEKENTIKSAKQGGRPAKFIGMILQTPSSFRSAFTNICGVPGVYILPYY